MMNGKPSLKQWLDAFDKSKSEWPTAPTDLIGQTQNIYDWMRLAVEKQSGQMRPSVHYPSSTD